MTYRREVPGPTCLCDYERAQKNGHGSPIFFLGLLRYFSDGLFADFARLRLGERVLEFHEFWNHEIFEPCLAVAEHLLLGDLRSRANGEHGFNGAAQNRV